MRRTQIDCKAEGEEECQRVIEMWESYTSSRKKRVESMIFWEEGGRELKGEELEVCQLVMEGDGDDDGGDISPATEPEKSMKGGAVTPGRNEHDYKATAPLLIVLPATPSQQR